MGGEGRCTCCCMSYQTRVTLFAVTNIFVTGFNLLLPLISSGFIIYFGITSQRSEATYVLHEETLSIFQRIPTQLLKPRDTSKLNVAELDLRTSPLQSDMHVWVSWIFVKIVLLIYSVLLYAGARKRNYKLIMSWFAINVPMTAYALMILLMDIGLGLMWKKPLKFQAYQISLVLYQLLGLLFVFCFLRRCSLFGQRAHRYSPSTGDQHYRGESSSEAKFRDPATLHFMYNGSNRVLPPILNANSRFGF